MDPSLITKYFSGSCSDEERKQVLDWFQTKKGQVFLREQIRKDCQRLTDDKSSSRCRDIDTESVLNQILNSIRADEQSATKENTTGINERLAFEDEPLWKISRKLEHVYDINIEFQSEQLKELSLTTDFKLIDAEINLQTIATMLDIEYKKASSSNYIWLKPPGASS